MDRVSGSREEQQPKVRPRLGSWVDVSGVGWSGSWKERLEAHILEGHRHRSHVVHRGWHPPQRRPDSQEQSGLAGRWPADGARGAGVGGVRPPARALSAWLLPMELRHHASCQRPPVHRWEGVDTCSWGSHLSCGRASVPLLKGLQAFEPLTQDPP